LNLARKPPGLSVSPPEQAENLAVGSHTPIRINNKNKSDASGDTSCRKISDPSVSRLQ
jgi:hypothetical protein